MVLLSSSEKVYGAVKVDRDLWEAASKLAGGKMLLARKVGEHMALMEARIPDELRQSYRATPWRAAFGKAREGIVEDYLREYLGGQATPSIPATIAAAGAA